MSSGSTTQPLHLHAQRLEARRKGASDMRKALKPLVEKRRRARINESLNNLKTLILPLVGKDNCRYSKVEKADILEMTVRYLRDTAPAPIKSASESYREGYRTCLQRVTSMLPKANLLDRETCHRLQQYLQQSLQDSASACYNCSRTAQSCGVQAGSSRGQPAPQILAATVWRPW